MAKEAIEVNVKEIKNILHHYLDATGSLNYALKITGHPGIGKSSIVRQAAEEKNFLFIDTRLAFKENIDLGGYPVPDHKNQRMIYFRPSFIPPPELPQGYKGILWFLDEANRAHPTVIQTLFQVISERCCGEHKLPEETAIVLAGNLGEEDQTSITDFDDAALDGRLATFHLKPEAKDWLIWALKEKIHPSIIRYISLFPERLWNEQSIHPNPRGWHQLSLAILKSYKLDSEESLLEEIKSPDTGFKKLIISLIGELAAFDFIRQLSHPRKISTKDILEGNREKLEAAEKEEISVEDLLWGINGAISILKEKLIQGKAMDDKEQLQELGNLLSFIAGCRKDSRLAFCHLLLQECGLLTSIPKAFELMTKTRAEKIALSMETLLS